MEDIINKNNNIISIQSTKFSCNQTQLSLRTSKGDQNQSDKKKQK